MGLAATGREGVIRGDVERGRDRASRLQRTRLSASVDAPDATEQHTDEPVESLIESREVGGMGYQRRPRRRADVLFSRDIDLRDGREERARSPRVDGQLSAAQQSREDQQISRGEVSPHARLRQRAGAACPRGRA